MADSIREQVLIALKTQLEEIQTGNDYMTDMGNSVHRGIRSSLEVDDMPAMVILEETEDVSQGPIGRNTCFLSVVVHGQYAYTANDSANKNWSTIGNYMIADIVKCIGADTTLGGLVIDIFPGTRSIGDPEPETNIMSVEVGFTIHYQTNHLDPYN